MTQWAVQATIKGNGRLLGNSVFIRTWPIRCFCAGFGAVLGGLGVGATASAQQDTFCDTLFQTANSINQCLGWQTYMQNCPDHALTGMGEILHGAACVETTTGDETTTVLKEVPPSEPVPEPEPEEKIVVAPAPDPVPEQVEERAPIELFADNAILDFGGAVLGALDAETAAALGLDVTSGMYILDWVGPRDRRLEGQVIQALDGNVVDSPRAYRSLLLEAHRGDTPSLMFFLADEGAGPFVSVPIEQAGLAAVKGLRDEEAAEMAINRSARRCDERAGSPFHPDLAVGRMSGNGVPPSKISEIGRQTVAICKAALTSFPDQPRMLFNLGRAYHGTGDTEAALDRSRGAALSNLKCTWIQRLPGRWLPLADRRAGGFRQVDFTIFVKNPPRETASVA